MTRVFQTDATRSNDCTATVAVDQVNPETTPPSFQAAVRYPAQIQKRTHVEAVIHLHVFIATPTLMV